MNRHLAAVLAADVVGYSALMARDEAGTLEALRRLRREVFHPTVAGHRGKVVKSMGDGWLVEFPSAVDAVNCALVVQQALARDQAVSLRIGIHIGDITHEDEDIFGDGVNVAARLEAFAEPGAIAISDAVHCALDSTLTPGFDDAGEQRLKNLPRPVRTWVRGSHLGQAARPAQAGSPTENKRQVDRILIVQPITAAGANDEIADLAAGLTSDLSQYLNGSRWMSVRIAETAPEDSMVLSGRLRTSGSRIRLEAALAEPTGETVWTDKVDGDLAEIFDWQDETASSVASSVFAVANELERQRLAHIPEGSRTAADWYRLALLQSSSNPETARLMISACLSAIERDPDWAEPWLVMLSVERQARMLGTASALADLIADPEDAYRKAMSLPPPERPGARTAAASLKHIHTPDLQAFRAEINAILRLNPNDQGTLMFGAWNLGDEDVPQMAYDLGKRALRFMTKDSSGAAPHSSLARSCFKLGLEEEGLHHALTAMELNGGSPATTMVAAAALQVAGRHEEARAVVSRLMALAPDMSVEQAGRSMGTGGHMDRYLDALREAGLPETREEG